MLESKEILYCLAISLQLSGALLSIYNSCNNLNHENLKVKKAILNYNHEAFLDFIHMQYKNFISFIYIFVGYILGILGKINNKIVGIIIIVIFTLLIILITAKDIKYKNNNVKKITSEELEKLNRNPTIETASDEDIENLF